MVRQANALRDTTAGAVLASGENVPLLDWLNVSWFYPDGFRKDRIVETARSVVVIGESVVYKFRKVPPLEDPRLHPADDSPSGFLSDFPLASRWKAAREEIFLNRALAAPLYLGIRLLRWIDGEPHWSTQFPDSDSLPSSASEDAHDAVLVMRRVPDEARLSAILADEEELSEERLLTVVSTLASFHRFAPKKTLTINRPGSTQAGTGDLRERYLHAAERLVTGCRYLDLFSQCMFEEIARFLRLFVTENEPFFWERCLAGRVAEVHGALSSRNIAFSDFDGDHPVVIGGRRRGGVQDDVLADLASLTTELDVLGFSELAREMERSYWKLSPGACDTELYRFHRVAQSALRACSLLTEPELGDKEGSPELAPQFLSFALQQALHLPQSFILAVCAGPAEERETAAKNGERMKSVASQMRELLPAAAFAFVPPSEALTVFHNEEQQFGRMLPAAGREVADGVPVIVEWPLARSEERLQLLALAEQHRVPLFVLECGEEESGALEPRFPGTAAQRILWSGARLHPPQAITLLRRLSSCR